MKASDLLLAACDVIEWQGWYKGLAQERRDGEPVKGGRVCAIGALQCASTGNDIVGAIPKLGTGYQIAFDYLTVYVHELTGSGISQYNDHVAETKDDVINILIGAAQIAYDNGD